MVWYKKDPWGFVKFGTRTAAHLSWNTLVFGNLFLHNIRSSLLKLKWKLYSALKVNPSGARCLVRLDGFAVTKCWHLMSLASERPQDQNTQLNPQRGWQANWTQSVTNRSLVGRWGRTCSLCRAVFTTYPVIYSLSATPRFWGFNLSSARCSLICLAHIYGFQSICLWLLSRLNSRSELSALMIVFIDFARSGATNMIQSKSGS